MVVNNVNPVTIVLKVPPIKFPVHLEPSVAHRVIQRSLIAKLALLATIVRVVVFLSQQVCVIKITTALKDLNLQRQLFAQRDQCAVLDQQHLELVPHSLQDSTRIK